MRRLIVGLLVLAAIVAAVAVVGPRLLDGDAWRGRIERAASEQLGREVRIAGEIGFTVLPSLSAEAADVTIANAEGFGDEPFAGMQRMRLGLALGPLLNREVRIEQFILTEPRIRLEQRGAENNWTFAPDDPASAPAGSGTGFRRPGALPFEASFGEVRIERGAVSYSSGGQSWALDSLNAALDMPDLDGPAALSGDFTLNGQALGFDMALGSLRGFMEGAATPLELSLTGDAVSADFEGRALESSEFEIAGTADVEFALRPLAEMAGADLPEGETFQRFAANGELSASPRRLTLSRARVDFDQIGAAGDMAVALDRDRPEITGALDVGALDLNPYLPEPAEDGAQNGQWSEEEIDLAPLTLVDADISASVDRLLFGEIEAADAQLRAVLENGALTATLERFSLYEGEGRAVATVSARDPSPRYALDASLDGLQAQPFLSAAADFSRLIGRGGMRLDLAADGRSPAAIMRTLDGTGRFDFADGAIEGVNLAQVIRTIQTAVETRELPSGFGAGEQTDFTSLGGTIEIADGVARNPDLALLSPLLRVAGAGEIDLPGQGVDYRLSPRAVRSLTGQGGEADLQGLEVPVRITGGFDDPRVSIDYQAVIAALARARAGDMIGGELGAGLSEGRSLEESARGAARDLLNEAFSGRRDSTAPEPAPGADEADDADDAPASDIDQGRALIEGLFGRSRTEGETGDEDAAPAESEAEQPGGE